MARWNFGEKTSLHEFGMDETERLGRVKYIILGASSFYGSHFWRLLEEKGHQVTGLYRPHFDPLKDFEIPEGDFVFNFISESLVEESWENPKKWIDTNIMASTRMIEKVPKEMTFFHVSTPEVYGSNTTWVKETCE